MWVGKDHIVKLQTSVEMWTKEIVSLRTTVELLRAVVLGMNSQDQQIADLQDKLMSLVDKSIQTNLTARGEGVMAARLNAVGHLPSTTEDEPMVDEDEEAWNTMTTAKI